MKKKNRCLLKKYIAVIFAVTLFICSYPIKTYAAEASVTFGSNWYDGENGEEFPVGVYIKGDSAITSYHVELQYDNLRLQYISGADEVDEENGLLIFEGNASSDGVKLWIIFEAISGGEASLKVVSATATSINGDNFTMTSLQEVPVHLSGEDTVGENKTFQQVEDERDNDIEMEQEPVNNEEALETQEEIEKEKSEPVELQKDEGETDVSHDGISILGIAIFVGITFGVILVGTIYIRNRKYIKRSRAKKRRAKKRRAKKRRAEKKGINVEITKRNVFNKIQNEEINFNEELVSESNEETEFPVIKVDNITMKYKVSTNSTSGLKEFIIQKIKKQITTRELLALDGVSFDVFKGEIVGIIGTNGSGKSTLLKIVSGALNPSGGQVIVDKKKIQLLTLGAGFDSELSARENVYLNGAIIGYSKEFIDEHYDEIVEFAELDGFMDEKVKNFSSGMVSRLGFSIATVGDAAEILILDEVLSVGDEFFRKKSLARVKEMIHGGSTVLMVSHGMGTIVSNCTKVVWIEKGKLQMVGDAKIVCAAYRRQFNQ